MVSRRSFALYLPSLQLKFLSVFTPVSFDFRCLNCREYSTDSDIITQLFGHRSKYSHVNEFQKTRSISVHMKRAF